MATRCIALCQAVTNQIPDKYTEEEIYVLLSKTYGYIPNFRKCEKMALLITSNIIEWGRNVLEIVWNSKTCYYEIVN